MPHIPAVGLEESSGAPEIEVTSDMIEAGVEAVLTLAGDIIPAIGGESRDLAMAVYLAMAARATARALSEQIDTSSI
jgi:hypothetical protein